MKLPEKWFIRRNPSNFIEVNKLMSKLHNKTYTGNGISKFGNEDCMHYPAVKTKRYKKGRVSLPYPNSYHTEISLQTLRKYMETQKDYTRNWYVRVTAENREKLSEWRASVDGSFTARIGGVVGISLQTFTKEGEFKKGHTDLGSIKGICYDFGQEITYDEFRFHILQEYTRQDWLDGRIAIERPSIKHDSLLNSFLKECNFTNNYIMPVPMEFLICNGFGKWTNIGKENLGGRPVIKDVKQIYKNEVMNQGEHIGYNLKYPEREAIVRKALGYTSKYEPFFIKGHIGGSYIVQCKELGIMDWFEPVYKQKPELPTIYACKGEDKGDFLKFGCAELPKAWFKDSSNRSIVEMKLSSGKILTASNIADIRNYLENV